MRNMRTGLASVALALMTTAAMAVPVTSSGDPALAGATIVDFQSVPIGRYSSLTVGDLVINGSSDFRINGPGGVGNLVPPDDNYLGNFHASFAATYATPLTFMFAGGTTAFGFAIAGTNAVQELMAYDLSSNLIEAVLIPAGGFISRAGFYGVNAGSTLISYATLTANGDDAYVIDDVTFLPKGGTVPEPTSLALLGVALLGLILTHTRKAQ